MLSTHFLYYLLALHTYHIPGTCVSFFFWMNAVTYLPQVIYFEIGKVMSLYFRLVVFGLFQARLVQRWTREISPFKIVGQCGSVHHFKF